MRQKVLHSRFGSDLPPMLMTGTPRIRPNEIFSGQCRHTFVTWCPAKELKLIDRELTEEHVCTEMTMNSGLYHALFGIRYLDHAIVGYLTPSLSSIFNRHLD